MENEPIFKFRKNDSEQIWITKSVFNDEMYYHIRLYAVSRMGGDVKYLPTQKGVAFKLSDMPNFFEAVDKLKLEVGRDIISGQTSN